MSQDIKKETFNAYCINHILPALIERECDSLTTK